MPDTPSSNLLAQSNRLTPYFALRALRKHWLLGLAVMLLVLAGAIFFTVGQKRVFRATASIQIDPNPPRPLGNQVQAVVDMGSGTYWSNKEYFTTQQNILEGRGIARETVRVMNLQHDASFVQFDINAKRTGREPDLEDATSVLISRLTVEPVRDSRLIKVSVVDVDPQRARRILSTLVDVYLQRNIDVVAASTSAASEWLHVQVEKLKFELEGSELALHEYKKDKQMLSVSLDDQSNMLRGEMQQLNEALTRANTKREELEARSRELQKIDAGDPAVLPSTELLSNSLLNSLRQEYIKSKSEYSGLLGEGKGEMHPAVESVRAHMETTRQSLLAEVRNVQGAVQADLVAVTREGQGIAGLFARAKSRAMDVNMLEIEYRRLERSKANTEKLYGMVLERTKESDLTSIMRFNNVSVVEPPVVPKIPYRPRVALNVAIGLAAGIFLGIITAFAKEGLDQTIRSPQDVETEIDVPLLGVLPMVSGQGATAPYYSRRRRKSSPNDAASVSAPELLVRDAPSSNVAECARSIRTSLMFASPDRPFRRILVTSASPGEGKTTVACTIAIAFAQVGERVLLIDCDLRRPRLHRIMRQDNSMGVTTILQKPAEAHLGILDSQIPNLSLITAGPHVPNPAELVQSESFGQLLGILSEKFDRIVLDSPPILAVTDATIIATRVDTTLVVVRAGKSRRDVVRQSLRKLHELGIPLVGLVLNGLEQSRGGNYYHYRYSYYGYGRKYEASSGVDA